MRRLVQKRELWKVICHQKQPEVGLEADFLFFRWPCLLLSPHTQKCATLPHRLGEGHCFWQGCLILLSIIPIICTLNYYILKYQNCSSYSTHHHSNSRHSCLCLLVPTWSVQALDSNDKIEHLKLPSPSSPQLLFPSSLATFSSSTLPFSSSTLPFSSSTLTFSSSTVRWSICDCSSTVRWSICDCSMLFFMALISACILPVPYA